MKELAPDLWQLRGMPPNGINVYLAGDVLIDAATKLARRRILRQLRGHQISALALTHVHPDHQGSADAICNQLGIPLACHAADVARMEGTGPTQSANQKNFLNIVIEKLWTGPPHKVDRVLSEGDMVGEFRVVHAPGHAPGEVIYFRDSDRVAIVGDVVNTMNLLTTRAGIHEAPDAFTLDRAESRRSILKLLALDPTLICAGHGPPMRDAAAKLTAFVERHWLRD